MAHKHPNKYSLLIPLIGVAVILFMFVVSVGSGALHNSDNRVTGRATQNSAGISVTLSGPSSVSDDFEVVAIARNIPSSVTGAVLRIYESDNLGNREKFIKDCKLGTANSVSANSVESVTQGECKAVIPTANWRNGDKHYYFAVLKHSSIVPNPTSALLTVTKSLGTYSIEFEEQTSGEVSGEFTFTAAADKPSDGKIRMEVDGVLINKCVESCVSKCKCSATVPAGTVDKWPSQSKHVISAILTDKQDGKLSRTDKTVTKSAFAQEIEITEPGDTVSAKFEITGKVPRIESDSKLKIILDETPVKRCLNGQNVCNVEVSDRVVNLWQTGSEHKITVVLLDQNEKEKLRKEKKITKKSPGTFQLVISSPTANEVSAGFDLKASVSPANVPSDSKLKLYRKNGGGQEELLNKCTGAADCLYTFSDDAVNRWTAGTQVVLGALLLDRQDGELARIEKTVTKQAYASELQLDVPNEPVFNAFDAVATATNKPSDSRLKFFLDDELPIKVCAKSENPCRATVNEQKVNSWQPGSGHIVHASLRDPQDKLISSTQKPVSRLKVDVSLAVPQEPVTGDFAVTATAGANFPQNSRLKIKVDNGAYVYLCEPNENPCTKTVLVGSHSTYKIVAVAKSESSVDLGASEEKTVTKSPGGESSPVKLLVWSNPSGLIVQVDGTYKGLSGTEESPSLIEGISTGQHTIKIKHPDYQNYETTETLIPGDNTVHHDFLEGLPSIHITVPDQSPFTVAANIGSFDVKAEVTNMQPAYIIKFRVNGAEGANIACEEGVNPCTKPISTSSWVSGINYEISAVVKGDGHRLATTEEPLMAIKESSPSPLSICGNGIVEQVEECDDGNSVDGDGCSSSCIIEYCPCWIPFCCP